MAFVSVIFERNHEADTDILPCAIEIATDEAVPSVNPQPDT